MMSLSIARLVVVCDQSDRSLVHALARMGLEDVRLVATPDEARQICAIDRVDACLAVLPSPIPDEAPPWTVETVAPGRETGVPSLLLAEVVTPYVAKSARTAGYLAAIPANAPPRLLYRWIGALLQKQAQQQGRTAAADRGRRDILAADAVHVLVDEASEGGKFKLQ